MAALDELAELYDRAAQDPAFWAEFEGYLADIVGRPSSLTPAPRLSAAVGVPVWLKREDLNHTGAHKINNTIGQALLALRMGKRRIIAETGRGTARRRDRDRVRALRPRVRRVHGRRGRRPPGAQRVSHAAARCDGRAGGVGNAYAQGRHQRGAARLGDQRSDDALHHRLGGGPRSVPAHGARLPGGDRARGAGPDAGAYGSAARHGGGVCRAAVRTRWAMFAGFLDDAAVELVGVEAAGEGLDSRRHSATLTAGTAGRAARQPELPAAGRRRAGVAGALGLGRARLSGRGAGAQLAPGQPAVCATRRPTIARRSTRSRWCAGSRASSRRSRRRTRSPGCCGSAVGVRPTASVLVCLSGRGDKDVAHVAAILGETA